MFHWSKEKYNEMEKVNDNVMKDTLKPLNIREFTFKEYQENVKITRNAYVESIDKLVDTGFGPRKQIVARMLRLSYLGLGLGETGEIQGKIKKLIRDSEGIITDDHKKAIKKELGDLLWYVAETCSELGFDMGEVAIENNDKLTGRKERGTLKGEGDDR